MIQAIRLSVQASLDTKQAVMQEDGLLLSLERLIVASVHCFRSNGRMLLCGNGGSAADAQHIAAELSGRFYYDRPPLDAEALHVNTSYLTAVANDYAYDEIFARLVQAKGRPGDLLLAFSTSGNSPNVVKAAIKAKEIGMVVACFTGRSGGKLKQYSDYLLNVPSDDTPRIQEVHMLLGHILCEQIELTCFPTSS